MDISSFESNAKELEKSVIIAKQNKNNIELEIASLESKCDTLTKANELLDKSIAILTNVANTSRDNARAHFEKIVTDALQFVTQSTDYEFIIKDIPGRAKASYEFYIKSTVNKTECIQKPEDANGGGFVDIISVASKYAYLEIFNDPRIMSGTLFFDEPGKMISEQMSVKFAEYLKFLGNHYNRQTIMITHNNNLSSVSDRTFVVAKDANGVSKAVISTNVTGISDDDMKSVEELYEN